MNEADTVPDSVFAVADTGTDGDEVLVPTRLARGPWNQGLQHGGPVSGLLARAVERQLDAEPPQHPMRVARLTIDLMAPVPMEPLTSSATVVKKGRQIQVIDAALHHQDRVVARASSVVVRCDRTVATDQERNAAASGALPLGRDGAPPRPFFDGVVMAERPTGFIEALEMVRVKGTMREGPPAEVWMRFVQPLVAGEVISPLQRAAALGDFTTVAGTSLDMTTTVSPNVDASYHFSRLPVGEWIGIDAATVVSPDGIAQSFGRLFDDESLFGRNQTSLVVSNRE